MSDSQFEGPAEPPIQYRQRLEQLATEAPPAIRPILAKIDASFRGSLISVALCREGEFTVVQDDEYTTVEFERIARDVELQRLLGDETQEELYAVGDFRYLVYGFSEGTVLRLEAGPGTIILIVRQDGEAQLWEFLRAVREDCESAR